MMEESKVNNSTDQLKVSTSTVFILREQDGTRTRKDLKILNQRNFTTLSLFFTYLLYLLLQVETNQDKVVVTRLKQSLLT
jgi:hypothetical protein